MPPRVAAFLRAREAILPAASLRGAGTIGDDSRSEKVRAEERNTSSPLTSAFLSIRPVRGMTAEGLSAFRRRSSVPPAMYRAEGSSFFFRKHSDSVAAVTFSITPPKAIRLCLPVHRTPLQRGSDQAFFLSCFFSTQALHEGRLQCRGYQGYLP